MTIESATYISDLDSSYPESTSQKKDGDNHIRLVKATIKTTLPNITGIMSASHTELNYMVGVTSAVQTQINTKGAHAGQTWTGTHNFTAATVSFGSPTATTQAAGDNSTKVATTAFVVGLGMAAVLPGQTDRGGLGIVTDGSSANWGVTAAEGLALMDLGIV